MKTISHFYSHLQIDEFVSFCLFLEQLRATAGEGGGGKE